MKTMKKLFAIIAVMMVIVYPVFADDIIAESTLIYTCDDSFWVNIPETIIVGEEASVEAMDVNIAPGKSIHVDISSPNDYVEIHSASDPNSTLHVFFNSADGGQITVIHPTVATFGSGESGSKQFTTYIDNTTDAIAGEYTGNVMFNIHCE